MSRKRTGPFLTTAWLLAMSLAAAAGPGGAWMTAKELKEAFGGKGIDGRYSSGSQFSEYYLEGGRIEYHQFGIVTGGKWSVRGTNFCTIYDSNLSGGCFQVKRVSENCFEFYFVARTEDKAAREPGEPEWTAQGWIKDQPNNCGPDTTVSMQLGR